MKIKSFSKGLIISTNGDDQKIFKLEDLLIIARKNFQGTDFITKLEYSEDVEKLAYNARTIDFLAENFVFASKNKIAYFDEGTLKTKKYEQKPLQTIDKANQYGFITEKTKTLFSPDLDLQLPPTEYVSWFTEKISKNKKQNNDKIYNLLINCINKKAPLKDIEDLIAKYTFLGSDFIDSFELNIEVVKPLERKLIYPINIEKPKIEKVEKNYAIIKSPEDLEKRLAQQYKKPIKYLKHLGLYLVECKNSELDELVNEIKRFLGLDAYKPKLRSLPKTKPRLSTTNRNSLQLTNLKQIGAYKAQKITKGEEVKIGVVDSGIDYDHNELKKRFEENLGYDFIFDTEYPLDDNGHGTHIAGIIAGETTGIATESTLYALKVLNKSGSGTEAHLLMALDWAIENQLDILNFSLGGSVASEIEEEALRITKNSGIILVAAAGNSGKNIYEYPAAYYNVVSVSAVDDFNEFANFSTYNDMVDITAPGVEIFSTYKDGMYASFSGTSMATPHVTGSIALVKSLNSSPERVEGDIIKTAQRLHEEDELSREKFGSGLVRADSAVYNYKNENRKLFK